MTNWITNKVVIFEKKDITKNIIDSIWDKENNNFLPASIMPIPNAIDDNPSSDALAWFSKNWGFEKVSLSNYEIYEDYCFIQFDTGWSPAIPLIEKLSEKFNVRLCSSASEQWEYWFYFGDKRKGQDSKVSEFQLFCDGYCDVEKYINFLEMGIPQEMVEKLSRKNRKNPIEFTKDYTMSINNDITILEYSVKGDNPFSDNERAMSFEKQEEGHLDENV